MPDTAGAAVAWLTGPRPMAPTLVLSAAVGSDRLRLDLHGSPRTSYRVETSDEWRTWTRLAAVTTDASGAAALDLGTRPGAATYLGAVGGLADP